MYDGITRLKRTLLERPRIKGEQFLNCVFVDAYNGCYFMIAVIDSARNIS